MILANLSKGSGLIFLKPQNRWCIFLVVLCEDIKQIYFSNLTASDKFKLTKVFFFSYANGTATFIQTDISQQLLDGLLQYLAQMSVVPKG